MYQDLSTHCDWLVRESHCQFANQVAGKLGTLLFKKNNVPMLCQGIPSNFMAFVKNLKSLLILFFYS